MKLDKFIGYIAFFFALLLPLSTKISNFLIIIFIVLCLVKLFIEKNDIKKPSVIFVLSTTIFVTILISYGSIFNFEGFLKYFGRYFLYLVLPFFFLNLNISFLDFIRKNAAKGLILGLLFSSIFLQITNIFKLKNANQLNLSSMYDYFHTHFYFTSPVNIHPVYLGLYFVLGILFILDYIKYKNNISFGLKICSSLAIFLFLLTIISLNSRIIYGILVICLSLYFVLWFYKTKSIYKIISILLIIISSYISFNLIKKTYIYDRMTTELKWELSNEINTKFNSTITSDSRVARWVVCKEVIKQKFIFGWGTGTEKDVLHSYFMKKGLKTASELRYDAHNQYLSFFIEFGFIGFLLTAIYYCFSIYYSFKSSRKIFSLCFFLSLLIICLTENFFKNNSGILYIAFFANLLTVYNYKYANFIKE